MLLPPVSKLSRAQPVVDSTLHFAMKGRAFASKLALSPRSSGSVPPFILRSLRPTFVQEIEQNTKTTAPPPQTVKKRRSYSPATKGPAAYVPPLPTQSNEEAAQAKLAELHLQVSDPLTWLAVFDEALDMDGWATNDALGKDAHPPKTANEDLRGLQSNIRSSLATGADIKAREESSTSRHVSGFSSTGRYLSLNRTQIRCSTVRCCR